MSGASRASGHSDRSGGHRGRLDEDVRCGKGRRRCLGRCKCGENAGLERSTFSHSGISPGRGPRGRARAARQPAGPAPPKQGAAVRVQVRHRSRARDGDQAHPHLHILRYHHITLSTLFTPFTLLNRFLLSSHLSSAQVPAPTSSPSTPPPWAPARSPSSARLR